MAPPDSTVLRVYAEMLRRKGLSIADAQRMPSEPEPWYVCLSWDAREERSYKSWFGEFVARTWLVPAARVPTEWAWWVLACGLHRRDLCTDHHHDESRERDLPRRQWLPVSAALVTLPRHQWPTRGRSASRTSTDAPPLGGRGGST